MRGTNTAKAARMLRRAVANAAAHPLLEGERSSSAVKAHDRETARVRGSRVSVWRGVSIPLKALQPATHARAMAKRHVSTRSLGLTPSPCLSPEGERLALALEAHDWRGDRMTPHPRENHGVSETSVSEISVSWRRDA